MVAHFRNENGRVKQEQGATAPPPSTAAAVSSVLVCRGRLRPLLVGVPSMQQSWLLKHDEPLLLCMEPQGVRSRTPLSTPAVQSHTHTHARVRKQS
jgi:hypothetical protein